MGTKIAIASDHAGFDLKERIKKKFVSQIDWLDLGTDSEDSVDYPDFGKAMGEAIKNGEAQSGILICGSGIGVSIAANRFPEVRAAVCTSPQMAKLAREHNNANVLALGARFLELPEAFDCVTTFLTTKFEGGRHERRVQKLSE